MMKYRIGLAFLFLGVLMLAACLLDIHTGKVDFYGLLAMPIGIVLGALASMFQIWRDSGKKIVDGRSTGFVATSENMNISLSADRFLTSPATAEDELRLLEYIAINKGDSARLNDDEQAFFIKVIREAKDISEDGRNAFFAKVYIAKKLNEFGSPALSVVAELYAHKIGS